jgi:hypothetical protein
MAQRWWRLANRQMQSDVKHKWVVRQGKGSFAKKDQGGG